MSDTTHSKIIGILALQGDYDAHRKMLSETLNAPTQYVRTVDELAGVDALVLPGGESTAIIKLMNRVGLDAAIQARIGAGMPAFGTCAGMILLARHIDERPDQPTFGAMNITVARNAFSRQIDTSRPMFLSSLSKRMMTRWTRENRIRTNRQAKCAACSFAPPM